MDAMLDKIRRLKEVMKEWERIDKIKMEGQKKSGFWSRYKNYLRRLGKVIKTRRNLKTSSR